MMHNDRLKTEFDRDGFVVVRDFLTGEEFDELNRELDRYIREVVPALPNTAAFHHDKLRPETLKQLQHMGGDAFFAEYRMQERWQRLAELLLGEECAAQEPEWFNKPPGTEHPTPPHQDNYYFCLRPPNVVTLWLALDAVDEENGCLRYVAGSHRRGIRPHNATSVLGFSQGLVDYGPDDAAGEVAVHLAPGDLLAHHGETIHRAEPNRSPTRDRRAFAMVFRGHSCRRDEHAYERYETALSAQHERLETI
jgi:phytanoyl-CoA hydroxylase